MPLLKSFLFSILIFSIAVFLTFARFGGESFMVTIPSAIILLVSSIIVSSDIQNVHILGPGVNNFEIMPLLSSICMLGMGSDDYLFYSLMMLLFALSFHVIISNSSSNCPIASQLFKMILFFIVFSFFFIKSLYILPVIILMILFFRAPVLRDLLVIVASFFSLFVLVVWVSWYFDYQLIDTSCLKFDINFLPFKSVSEYEIITIALISFIFFHSFIVRFFVVKAREVSDNIIGRIISFVFLLIVVLCLILVFAGGNFKPYCISWFAIPYSVIVSFHLSNVRKKKSKKLILFLHISLILTVLFMNYVWGTQLIKL